MNMFKKNGGFTLVELIVVIAILAILAAVAVPAYSGYITKAKDAAVVSELSAVLTAVQATNATTGGAVSSIEITSTALKIGGSAVDADALEPFYTEEAVTALQAKLAGTSYANGAKWENNTWSPIE